MFTIAKKVYIFLAVLFLLYGTTQVIYANEIKLSKNQLATLKQCYHIGKRFDLGNTLAGICWVESKGGDYKINTATHDYGVAGTNLYTALKRLDLPKTWHYKNKLATDLVTQDNLSIQLGLLELLYWRDTRKRTYWPRMVESYNKGNSFKTLTYSRKVAEAIAMLKEKGILKDN